MKSSWGCGGASRKAFRNNEYFWKHHKHLMPRRGLLCFILEPIPFLSVTERWNPNVWSQQNNIVLFRRRGSGEKRRETDSWSSVTKNNLKVKLLSGLSCFSLTRDPHQWLLDVLTSIYLNMCKYWYIYMHAEFLCQEDADKLFIQSCGNS